MWSRLEKYVSTEKSIEYNIRSLELKTNKKTQSKLKDIIWGANKKSCHMTNFQKHTVPCDFSS